MNKKQKPPESLSIEGKRLWKDIESEAELDAPAVLLLNTVCEAFDRMRQAQAIIAEQGIVLVEKTDAGSVKSRVHPAAGVERDARAAMLRAWKLLGFDQEPPGSI